ncbi:MAG: hypothetical protein M5U22_05520 [Thermoleophilia bacterium]|nr:hypothetical protein [Thermoleophilia bacterium]
MKVQLHGIPEEIRIGDLVQTIHGVGTVTAISKPTSDRDRAMLEVDLGHKWMSTDEVDAIIIKAEGERRRSPEMHWDERE